jgi:hypothetical protein
MIKITYSIHGAEDMELAGEEKEFGFERDESSPFSNDFPQQVSTEDLEVLHAIMNLVKGKNSEYECIPNEFRVYACVSSIYDCEEWCEMSDPSRWFVDTDMSKIEKCDPSGWQPY